LVSPATASVEAPAATSRNRLESLRAMWMIAQGPPVDPNTQGGAPFAPPPASALPAPPVPPPPVHSSPPAIPQYRVAGVASNDVLNIRSRPDAGSAIVSTIPPYGSGIRMTGSCAGQWCPIDYRGSQGWVNRRYLTSE
jgi:hypothetical protein